MGAFSGIGKKSNKCINKLKKPAHEFTSRLFINTGKLA